MSDNLIFGMNESTPLIPKKNKRKGSKRENVSAAIMDNSGTCHYDLPVDDVYDDDGHPPVSSAQNGINQCSNNRSKNNNDNNNNNSSYGGITNNNDDNIVNESFISSSTSITKGFKSSTAAKKTDGSNQAKNKVTIRPITTASITTSITELDKFYELLNVSESDKISKKIPTRLSSLASLQTLHLNRQNLQGNSPSITNKNLVVFIDQSTNTLPNN